jgi:hypothetical protein
MIDADKQWCFGIEGSRDGPRCGNLCSLLEAESGQSLAVRLALVVSRVLWKLHEETLN